MLESINNIEGFIIGIIDCNGFVSNKLVCHAVAYNLHCIGESAYKLSREFVKSHTDVDWQAIEGLRHVLVHDYYTVNFSRVWQIVTNDIQPLKEWIIAHS